MRVLIALLFVACLHGEMRSLTLNDGVLGTFTTGASAAHTGAFTIEFGIHGTTIPSSLNSFLIRLGANKLMGFSLDGLAVQSFNGAGGTSARNSITLGGNYVFRLVQGPAADPAATEQTLVAWTPTGARTLSANTTTLASVDMSSIRIGNDTAIGMTMSLAFLRVYGYAKDPDDPMPTPTAITSGDILNQEFNDTSTGVFTDAGAAYTDTPAYAPFCNEWVSRTFRAGEVATLAAANYITDLREQPFVSYLWQQTEGPQMFWSSHVSASPTVQMAEFGQFGLRLTASNGVDPAITCSGVVGAVAQDSNGVVIPKASDTVVDIVGPMIADGKNPLTFADVSARKMLDLYGSQLGTVGPIENRKGLWDDDPQNWGPGTVTLTNGSATVTCDSSPGTPCNLATTFCAGGSSPSPSVVYIHLNYPIRDAADSGWTYARVSACASETQITISSVHGSLSTFNNGGTGGATFTGRNWSPDASSPYVINSWNNASPSSNTFYDPGLALYSQYLRTGLTKYLTWFRWVADRHWTQHRLNKGYPYIRADSLDGAPFEPRDMGATMLFLRALDGRSDMWPGLRRLTDRMRELYVTPTVFGDREVGYAFATTALQAMADPDSGETVATITDLNTGLSGNATSRRCTGGSPGRDCGGRNGNRYAVQAYQNDIAGGNGFASFGNAKRAVATNGNDTVTLLGVGSVPVAGASWNQAYFNGKYFYRVGDRQESYYQPEFVSNDGTDTVIRLRTYDGLAYRPYEGASTGGSGDHFVIAGIAGEFMSSCWMPGIIIRGLHWTNLATGDAFANTIISDLAQWQYNYCYDPTTKGLYYGRGAESCEPGNATYNATIPVRTGCSYVSVASSRALTGEIWGGSSIAYRLNPTSNFKTRIDQLYAAAYGRTGYAATGDFSSLVDGQYSTTASEFYTLGAPLYNQAKYVGFHWGFGGGFSWPAARLGPRSAVPVGVPIRFTLASHPSAADAQIQTVDPNGAVVDTRVCSSSPCVIKVPDSDMGRHRYRLNLRNGSGAVVVAGRLTSFPSRGAITPAPVDMESFAFDSQFFDQTYFK